MQRFLASSGKITFIMILSLFCSSCFFNVPLNFIHIFWLCSFIIISATSSCFPLVYPLSIYILNKYFILLFLSTFFLFQIITQPLFSFLSAKKLIFLSLQIYPAHLPHTVPNMTLEKDGRRE